ncbi:IS21 family transposase [Lentibacillus cibarius]|uniref:IS21 family transposase n=1 Tax=Lentibacillus cibarius TaxID=2583219 RepID=A0A5S3QMN7_9BACI|nr:IS21 family transposase [Lentibacillus cibarius]TMN21820.1 IS21 family transposase [Lentibacillus cibarius]TMN22928.1 IS21 family transposase [Lentibacillus cibarius]
MDKFRVYTDIRQLYQQGFKVAQIARKLGISRTTVYDYLNREPEEMSIWVAGTKERSKKLDPYENEIFSWLKKHPDLSAAQIQDWLLEKHGNMDVAASTVRNYVSQLRGRYHIPKVLHVRDYEAIPDPPMGQQAQVDFGETKQQTTKGEEKKLYFICLVLSNSRYKTVMWWDRPFTTKDVIQAHETFFEQLDGMPEEIVYDQDRVILVDENAGDLIFTADFQKYREERGFRVYMCKKADPESKGRVENVVGFVKNGFAKHRVFDNIDKWNETCQEWLDRTGNGKIHNTTKKKPDTVFQIEKKHLRPVIPKANILKKDDFSITVTVRKDNTILYDGNRYSVPLGTYQHGESNQVHLLNKGEILTVIDGNGEIIAEHKIDNRKGELIQASNHRRDRSKDIEAYIQSLASRFENPNRATTYLGEIRKCYPRHARDQLQVIAKCTKNSDSQRMEQALIMCVDNRLYSGNDFRDVLNHLHQEESESTDQAMENDVSSPVHKSYENCQPTTRALTDYISILEGGSST